jgi:hypothetical protein
MILCSLLIPDDPYGGDNSESGSDALYPVAGAGVQYHLKPKEGMVLNLEYAHDKNDNSGVYLKMGYAYLGEIMEKL